VRKTNIWDPSSLLCPAAQAAASNVRNAPTVTEQAEPLDGASKIRLDQAMPQDKKGRKKIHKILCGHTPSSISIQLSAFMRSEFRVQRSKRPWRA